MQARLNYPKSKKGNSLWVFWWGVNGKNTKLQKTMSNETVWTWNSEKVFTISSKQISHQTDISPKWKIAKTGVKLSPNGISIDGSGSKFNFKSQLGGQNGLFPLKKGSFLIFATQFLRVWLRYLFRCNRKPVSILTGSAINGTVLLAKCAASNAWNGNPVTRKGEPPNTLLGHVVRRCNSVVLCGAMRNRKT